MKTRVWLALGIILTVILVPALIWQVRSARSPVPLLIIPGDEIPNVVYLRGPYGETIDLVPAIQALGGKVATYGQKAVVVELGAKTILVSDADTKSDPSIPVWDEHVVKPVFWVSGKVHIGITTFLEIVNDSLGLDYAEVKEGKLYLSVNGR